MTLRRPVRATLALLVTLAGCSASGPMDGPQDAASDAAADTPEVSADAGTADRPEPRSPTMWREAMCSSLQTRPTQALCATVPTEGDWCSTEGDTDGGLRSFRGCLDHYVPMMMRLPQPELSRVGTWVLQCPGIPAGCWEACGADRRLYLGEVVQRAIGYAWQTGTCWPVE